MGSSPLTRGKYFAELKQLIDRGLIPAHAGKMQRAPLGSPPPEAHPRSRGENAIASALATFVAGSSPLTRGKLRIGCVRGTCVGLIPAHAGKTRQMRDMRQKCRAHPRSRGENIKAAVSVVVEWGSSPLTRGKPRCSLCTFLGGGLIPAHAGKTRIAIYNVTTTGAHPRSRGENSWPLRRSTSALGSSPLTRGKLINDALTIIQGGLIPAHAGKTSLRMRSS